MNSKIFMHRLYFHSALTVQLGSLKSGVIQLVSAIAVQQCCARRLHREAGGGRPPPPPQLEHWWASLPPNFRLQYTGCL